MTDINASSEPNTAFDPEKVERRTLNECARYEFECKHWLPQKFVHENDYHKLLALYREALADLAQERFMHQVTRGYVKNQDKPMRMPLKYRGTT